MIHGSIDKMLCVLEYEEHWKYAVENHGSVCVVVAHNMDIAQRRIKKDVTVLNVFGAEIKRINPNMFQLLNNSKVIIVHSDRAEEKIRGMNIDYPKYLRRH